jgi:tyrosinase
MKEIKSRGLDQSHERNLGGGQRGEKQPTPTDVPLSKSALEQQLNGVVFVGGRYREWIANIRVRKQALNEPFSIHLFLGTAPKDPREWTRAPNHIGTMGVFSSDRMYGMQMGGLDVSGTIPLTSSLVTKVLKGELPGLEPLDVERYLKRNLQKRVLGASGMVYELSRAEGLGISIASSVVQAPMTEEELPLWGGVMTHFDLS